MASAIDKYVILLDDDVQNDRQDWHVKDTAATIEPLRPPAAQIGGDVATVPRKQYAMTLVAGERHTYSTVGGAPVKGAIYRAKKKP